jgi:glutamate-1-semialdehyde 2,1-aminomutase
VAASPYSNSQLDRLGGEIASFVPPDSFDVHAHLYRACDSIPSLPQHMLVNDGTGNQVAGWQSWRDSLQKWLGDRAPAAGLFFAFPKSEIDFQQANEFVLNEVRQHADCRALLLIHPADDPASIDSLIETSGSVGFKVYRLYADRGDTMNAELGEFLPEWAWEIADRRQLAIMLHIVRDRALSDPANLKYIREHCLKYSHAKLILAHAARGFCAAHTGEGIAGLRGLDNVYFDTSVVCESPAFSAILREFGTTRLMFGSDFPVSEMRGKCVSVGDRFLWLTEDNVGGNEQSPVDLTLVGVESILAIRRACQDVRLGDADAERIFRTNARQLLGLDRSSHNNVTQQLYQRAKQLIPGGSQLLSKRPEMYAPGHWPAYFREARGCQVVDLDGREYCDMTTSGIGSCLLGFNDQDVSSAVLRRVQLGSMSSLNAAEDIELAELMVSLHPWAEQVRFCRTGGETMAAAVRVARAATNRDTIAFCGYHGWSDWYLAANIVKPGVGPEGAGDKLSGHLLPGLSPSGVPSGLAATALPFAYNRIEELRQIANEHGSRLAAVVMEPFRSAEPLPGFLEEVREICDRCGAVLVFDEITSGWRFGLGGIHLQFGVTPDIAVFAKAISNGFPMGAIIGRRQIMEVVQTTFVSSTYWTESIGPTAALATIHKLQRTDAPTHVAGIGSQLRAGLSSLGAKHSVPLHITGRNALLYVAFDHPSSGALGTLFTVRMLARGLLAGGGFYPSLAHEARHVQKYIDAADEVFPEISLAMELDDAVERLKGEVRHSGFTRLT